MKYSRYRYLQAHWKLAVHIIFRTRHFGVNNKLYSKRAVPYGQNLARIILNTLLGFPLWRAFKLMRWRMGPTVGFIPYNEYLLVFHKK